MPSEMFELPNPPDCKVVESTFKVVDRKVIPMTTVSAEAAKMMNEDLERIRRRIFEDIDREAMRDLQLGLDVPTTGPMIRPEASVLTEADRLRLMMGSSWKLNPYPLLTDFEV